MNPKAYAAHLLQKQMLGFLYSVGYSILDLLLLIILLSLSK